MSLSLNAYQMQAVHLLRALRGAPIACLHALHIMHPRPLGRADLVSLTGFNRDAITKAMTLLVNVYFLAARIGRYESWCLTDKGKQLPLPLLGAGNIAQNQEIAARALLEGDFSAPEPSSSSSYLLVQTELNHKTTTTPEGDFSALEPKFDLPPRIAALHDEWFDGCPQTLFRRAMQTALERGDPAVRIEYRAVAWSLYTQSPFGANIRARSIFVARKIENDERCPEIFDEMDRDWRRQHADALKRLDDLETELNALAEESHDA